MITEFNKGGIVNEENCDYSSYDTTNAKPYWMSLSSVISQKKLQVGAFYLFKIVVLLCFNLSKLLK